LISIQLFGVFREFGRLKSDRDSAADRPAAVTDESYELTIVGSGLSIQQVSRVENGFRLDRQAKAREVLRYLNTQGRIVNTESSGEWIDCENRRFRRETEDGSHLRTATETSAEL
jgi:hypothetical protein